MKINQRAFAATVTIAAGIMVAALYLGALSNWMAGNFEATWNYLIPALIFSPIVLMGWLSIRKR